ncbi:MAG: hypothetical protein WC341_09980 [Bacteroidales bacterium]|jgi:predicted choloylglycine hydrolase
MKTRIFVYKDVLGIETPKTVQPQTEFANGEGAYTMAKLEDVEFSQEAVDFLKTFPTAKEGSGSFFLFIDKVGNKGVVWVGGKKVAIRKENIQVITDFDYSEVTVAKFNVPKQFKDFVDNLK